MKSDVLSLPISFSLFACNHSPTASISAPISFSGTFSALTTEGSTTHCPQHNFANVQGRQETGHFFRHKLRRLHYVALVLGLSYPGYSQRTHLAEYILVQLAWPLRNYYQGDAELSAFPCYLGCYLLCLAICIPVRWKKCMCLLYSNYYRRPELDPFFNLFVLCPDCSFSVFEYPVKVIRNYGICLGLGQLEHVKDVNVVRAELVYRISNARIYYSALSPLSPLHYFD